MKLIFCPECSDIVRLFSYGRACRCGLSWGHYIDDNQAAIGGKAVPLGIGNESFHAAFRARPHEGKGATFKAWVMPEQVDSITVEAA
jgi:hypothetical protein